MTPAPMLTRAQSACLPTDVRPDLASDDIAFFSTARVNEHYDLQDAILRVLRSQHFVLGKEVAAFEVEFASYCNVRHAIGVGSGTDALELSLRAVGMGRGHRIVTVANAGFYTSAAALAIGATPIYVDVCENTRTMCPQDLELVLSQQSCDCVVVTHLFGQMADISRIKQIADRHHLPLIEDCAQAHGAEIEGVQAGVTGIVSTFSFYPTKNLGALGDGGAVVTSDDHLAKVLRSLRQYGWGVKYHVELVGGRNSRLDEMQAAILRLKLPNLNLANKQRIAIAARYNDAFADLPIRCPQLDEQENVCHLYVVAVDSRDAFRQFLESRGIPTVVHYPILDCSQPILANATKRSLPRTTRLSHAIVSLPCYPSMPEVHIARVIRAVLDFHGDRQHDV